MPPKAKGGGGSKGGGGGLPHADRQLPEAAKKKQSKQTADRQAETIAGTPEVAGVGDKK